MTTRHLSGLPLLPVPVSGLPLLPVHSAVHASTDPTPAHLSPLDSANPCNQQQHHTPRELGVDRGPVQQSLRLTGSCAT